MLRDYDSTSISVLPSNQATYPYSLHSVQASTVREAINRFRANIVIHQIYIKEYVVWNIHANWKQISNKSNVQ